MDNFEIRIDDLDMHSYGIAHKDGKTIFVDNALPTEIIKAKLIKQQKNIIFAKNIDLLQKSEYRKIPLCPYFFDCGGCDIQHLCYEKALEYKKQQITLSFKKICGINLGDFEIVKSPQEYFYRNKISMKICDYNGEKVLCYYKKNSHDKVKIESCKIANQKFDEVIKFVNLYLKYCSLPTYNEKEKTGTLKHLVARIIDGKLLLTFVLNENKQLKNIESLYQNLLKHFEKVGINKNINKSDKQILSDNFENIVGDNVIEFENLNIKQQITNASFLQVNTFVANKIYEYVCSLLNGNIVNCYAGAGLLSGIIANKNKKSQVFGIEINKQATMLAEILKEKNKILNLTNLCGDSGKVLENLNLKNFNLVVDPPKSGLAENMIKNILKFLPQKIVYISCDKISLAKNYNSLKQHYKIDDIKAFDMFPQTVNVETVLILSKI